MRKLLLATLLAFPLFAEAQYPTKPLRAVVAFGTGGTTDVTARIIAAALSQSLGQPVVIDNKPGADGIIAGQEVVEERGRRLHDLVRHVHADLRAAVAAQERAVRSDGGLHADRRHRQLLLLLGGESRAADQEPEGARRVRARQSRQAERRKLRRGRDDGADDVRPRREVRPAGGRLQERNHGAQRPRHGPHPAHARERHARPASARRARARDRHPEQPAQQGASRPADHDGSGRGALPGGAVDGPLRPGETAARGGRAPVARAARRRSRIPKCASGWSGRAWTSTRWRRKRSAPSRKSRPKSGGESPQEAGYKAE